MEHTAAMGTVAPLVNVGLASRALEAAMNRPGHLPGMVTFYGPSGWGKSTAAAYAANKHRAYYVECKSAWTRKALLLALCKEMGLEPRRTLYELIDQVAEQLVLSGRPLIIDELDHIAAKGAVEIVRDLYDASGAAILLIGEERLPSKLEKWERFHNRMLDWVAALPASLEDCRHLARLYCPGVEVADDLLAEVHRKTGGNVRRICVNLERVRAEAAGLGLDRIDRKRWGDREIYTGKPRRRAV